MSRKIDHIGIAIENLDQAIETYSLLLNQEPNEIETIEDQKVRVAIFKTGNSKIELLEGLRTDSPISKFIAKRGPGIHHLCLIVENLELELKRLKASGRQLIDETPRIGTGGSKVAFIHPRSSSGILIELKQLAQ
ncbi:MAG: methylmalonyl-CoA epimerase [Candidatus Zixiibacteriota bacterium]